MTMFENKYVLVRTAGAGVHAGVLVSREDNTVILKESRRIWCWDSRGDKIMIYTLSDVSRLGVGSKGRVSAPIEEHMILGVCEIIVCSPEGETALRESPVWG